MVEEKEHLTIELSEKEFFIDPVDYMSQYIEIFYKGEKVNDKVTGIIMVGKW